MQQAGRISLVGLHKAGGGEFLRKHPAGQAMAPTAAKQGRLHSRFHIGAQSNRDGQCFHKVQAQRNGGVMHAADLAACAVKRRIGHAQHLAGKDRVRRKPAHHLPHIHVFLAQEFHHFHGDGWEGRWRT